MTDITNKYKDDLGITYGRMATMINENLDNKIGSQIVYGWAKGALPRLDILARIMKSYPEEDWRHKYAKDILNSILYE